MDCPNCHHPIAGNYCSNCGRPAALPRINGKYIRKEIGSVLSLDKGILLTIRELLLRPGQNIRAFLREERNRLVKPIIFIIICSLFYTLAQQLLHFEDKYVSPYSDLPDSALRAIFEWIQVNYGYANILMAFFIAFWTKLLFRNRGYNYFEVLVLIFFIMGIGMLINSVFGIVEYITTFSLLHIGGLMAFLYAAWAIAQFFDPKKKVNYLKGLLAYLIGFITCLLSTVIVGLIIDAIV